MAPRELTDDEVFGGVPGQVWSEAQRQNVDPAFAVRVARQESGFRPDAVSPKGARGPMQLMPGTARELGVDPNDPAQNIQGGVRYLGQQLHAFNGDQRLAAAAYNAGPGRVRQAGGVPAIPETQAYVEAVAPQQELSDAEVFGSAPHGGITGPTIGGVTVTVGGDEPPAAAGPQPAAPPAAPQRVNQAWGFQEGVAKPFTNIGNWLVHGAENAGLEMSGFRTVSNRLKAAQAAADARDPTRVNARPGKIGEFAGNVVGTLPLSLLPGGAGVQGAASGALLSDAKDAKGVAADAAVGAFAGKAADKGVQLLGKGAQAILGKAPKIMSLPQLKAAVDDAYDKVRAAGIVIPKAHAQALANDVEALIRTRGGPKAGKLYADADALAARLKALAGQKGGLPIEQLEELRSDIYTALVKPGGKESVLGGTMRQKIDAVMDQVAKGNPLLRDARELNTRWAKARTVERASKSADIRAEKDYGGDYGRKIKDRLFPLIDPQNANRNLRGATKDEAAALKKVVTGTKAQNFASTAGGMLDPRRLGGKILAGITAPGAGIGAGPTAGLSLLVPAAQMAAGFGLTGTASSIARRNVDDLLKLIAVGGSRQALKKQATPASRAAQAAVAKARPVAGLIGGSAAAQARSR